MSKLHALGPAGSYSSLAAHHVTKTTGNDFEIVYEESLVNIIPKVNCEAYAIVPIENRYGGVVADTMNTLYQYRNAIRVIGWVNLAIHHCLAMRSDGDKDPAWIQTVYSHPQWLVQCQKTLRTPLYQHIRQVATRSTTEKASTLTRDEAIICSREAAEKYQLAIIDTTLAPRDNVTHFALLGQKEKNPLPGSEKLNHDRTIGILSTADTVGALSDVLTLIKNSKLNLHFILSMANGDGGMDFPIVMDQKWEEKLSALQADVEHNKLGNLHVL